MVQGFMQRQVPAKAATCAATGIDKTTQHVQLIVHMLRNLSLIEQLNVSDAPMQLNEKHELLASYVAKIAASEQEHARMAQVSQAVACGADA
jgi:hypothetical protein